MDKVIGYGLLNDFDLSNYKGKIYDSYDVAYEEVLSCNNDIVVVALSPFSSLAKVIPVLKKYNTKIVTMSDSLQSKNFTHHIYKQEYDVFEDLEAMRFSVEVMNALRLLTHENGVDYFEYVNRIKEILLSTKVKSNILCSGNTSLIRRENIFLNANSFSIIAFSNT